MSIKFILLALGFAWQFDWSRATARGSHSDAFPIVFLINNLERIGVPTRTTTISLDLDVLRPLLYCVISSDYGLKEQVLACV